MNAGIDVPTIQRFGALYIASARLKSMSKWRTIIAAVDIGNPLFYLIAVGIGIGVLVEQGPRYQYRPRSNKTAGFQHLRLQ